MLFTPLIPLENILAIADTVQRGEFETWHVEIQAVLDICAIIEASVTFVVALQAEFGIHTCI